MDSICISRLRWRGTGVKMAKALIQVGFLPWRQAVMQRYRAGVDGDLSAARESGFLGVLG